MEALSIRRLSALPDGLAVLEAEAAAEGFRFLTRLTEEWNSGHNRFDQPGECLLGAFRDGRLIAIGGLSRDPHAGPQVGRLRRLYVERASRGQQVGRALVLQLLKHAAGRFDLVRLRTDTPEAAAFYLRCGFAPIRDASATHAKSLAPSPATGVGPAR